MEGTQKVILHIIYILEGQKQNINIQAIGRNLSWAEGTDVKLEHQIEQLVEQGYLMKGKEEGLQLTDSGRKEAYRISREMVNKEFNKKIGRLTTSQAYLDFCEDVYGYRMYLFNMMDQQQLDFIFNGIHVSKEDRVLDLGCGTGSILNYWVTKTGCTGIGIDQLTPGIVQSNSRKITYLQKDIDRLSEVDAQPSVVLAVDSLYFSTDLDGVIRQMKSISNCRLYLFYSQYILDGSSQDGRSLHCDNTRLAQGLHSNGLSYKTIDYSENERTLYEKAVKILPKYRHVFEQEGNGDLYEVKLREDQGGKELYDKKLASRYLYIVQ